MVSWLVLGQLYNDLWVSATQVSLMDRGKLDQYETMAKHTKLKLCAHSNECARNSSFVCFVIVSYWSSLPLMYLYNFFIFIYFKYIYTGWTIQLHCSSMVPMMFPCSSTIPMCIIDLVFLNPVWYLHHMQCIQRHFLKQIHLFLQEFHWILLNQSS